MATCTASKVIFKKTNMHCQCECTIVIPHPAKLVSTLQSYKSAVFNYTSNLDFLKETFK